MADHYRIGVLTRSRLWNSLLKRRLCQQDIDWAIDVDELLSRDVSHPPEVAILELNVGSLPADCQLIFERVAAGSPTKYFAVGDSNLLFWLPWIRGCGFLDNCFGLSDFEHFASTIETVLDCGKSDAIDIETWVEQNLPWKPICRRARPSSDAAE
jgi:hypothetical protein